MGLDGTILVKDIVVINREVGGEQLKTRKMGKREREYDDKYGLRHINEIM